MINKFSFLCLILGFLPQAKAKILLPSQQSLSKEVVHIALGKFIGELSYPVEMAAGSAATAPLKKKPLPQKTLGQKRVEKILAENRKKFFPGSPSGASAQDIVEAKKGQSKKALAKEMAERELGESNSEASLWEQQRAFYQQSGLKVKSFYQTVAEKRKEFFKQLPLFKKNLIEEDKKSVLDEEITIASLTVDLNPPAPKLIPTPTPEKAPEVKEVVQMPKTHLIPGFENVLVKNQMGRATCTAFASAYAVENMIKQNGEEIDLSEQYLYWASKPNCQSSPCSEQGATLAGAFKFSEGQTGPDIPKEENCPYEGTRERRNETQTPLKSQCNKGFAKVSEYNRVKSLNDIVAALEKNQPVIAGFTLSENFFSTDGFVWLSEAEGRSKKKHSQGHAVLLIGYLELPPSKWEAEGRVCLFALNSWGPGWGKNGVACLSENWIKKYRFRNPFVSLEKVEVASN